MLNADAIRKIYSNNILVIEEDMRRCTRYTKYTEAQKLEIVKEAIAKSVREVADSYGIKHATLYSWINKSGIKHEKSNKTYTDIEKRVIIEYSYKHGLIKAKEKFGAAHQTICNWRNSYKVA